MKLDGLTFMLRLNPSSNMMGEDLDNMLYKQKRRLLFILFLPFAMMFLMDLHTTQVLPNNPWILMCFHFCFKGSIHVEFHITLNYLNFLYNTNLLYIICSQTLLANCLEGYWAAYDKSG